MKKLLHYLMMSTRYLIYSFIIQCLLVTVLFAANSNAQVQSINEVILNGFDLKDSSIKDALIKIEKLTNFNFVYTKSDLPGDVAISFSKSKATVGEVLLEISKQAQVKFQQVNNNISVKKITSPLDGNQEKIEIFIQTRNITGKVTSADEGEPLPGVNVVEKGTSNGTVTDIDGRYSLKVSEGATLVFSSVGYTQEEVEIGNRSTVNLVLQPDIKQLEELVVVGYGSVKRSDLTGSIASVKAEDFKSQPILSVDHALQGRAAGVQVTQSDGAPGSGISIRIRGGNSLQAGNEPLYVIDGIPIYSDNSQFSAGDYHDFPPEQNAMASLNPGDIASIEILKDASATAIYGSRGANGVVIITTKRGQAGDTKVNFDAFYGIQEISNRLEVLSGPEYIAYLNEAYRNAGKPEPITDSPDNYADVDMQDQIFRTAPVQNYQLTVSGGNEKTNFAVIGNFQREDGILINSHFNRYSLRFNLDHDISKNLRLGNSLSLSNTLNHQVPTGGAVAAVASALEWIPIVPIRNDDGEYIPSDWDVISWSQGHHNPVQRINLEQNVLDNKRLLANFFVEWDILPDLTFKTSGGIDYNNSKREYFQPASMARVQNVNGIGKLFHGSITSLLNENTLNYRKTFGIHEFTFLAGYTQQTYINELTSTHADQFTTDVLDVWDLGAGSSSILDSEKSRWDLLSWLGRVNYTLNDKYLFTASFRADGSSRFAEGNKWGVFPSGAFAWRLGNEPFMDNLNFLSDLKFRTSYGITGNAEIGTYQSVQRLVSGLKDINNNVNTIYYPEGLPVQDLRWEETAQFDVGLDLGFFDNRLNFTIDYYQKTTNDLLVNIPLPLTAGIGSILKNIGSLKNTGFEFSTDAYILTGDFSWNVNGNISFNQNEVTDLGGIGEYFLGNLGWFTNYNLVKVGEPIGTFWGLIYDGVWQEGEAFIGNAQPGDPKFRDISGPEGQPDGVINNLDNTIIGNALPDAFYGFTNRFSYKNFELSVFFQGVTGNDILNNNLTRGFSMTGNSNDLAAVKDRWTPQNTDTDVPRANADALRDVMSSRVIDDGSFLRLKTLTLGYNLDGANINWLQNARVYFTANNLFTFTEYKGYDPEVNMSGQSNLNLGVDWGVYPRPRTFILGLNVGF